MRKSSSSIVLGVALLAALSIAAVLLFLFKERLRESREKLPQRIAAAMRPEMLRLPDEIPRFDVVERFAQWAMEEFPISHLNVTKLRVDNAERCIYPWHGSASSVPEGIRIPIEQSGTLLGYLYLSPDTSGERTLEAVINILIPLLILFAIVLAFHVWRQETMLAVTRVQLAEKNRELGHLERLSLVGQLSANLLHDLKKPVLHIRDELKQKDEPIDKEAMAEQAEMFFQMLKETQLERFAGASEEKPEYLDIQEVLETALNLVKYERRHVQVDFEPCESLPLILGRKYRLVQVFSNLLLNAFQALQGRGKVRITTVDHNKEGQVQVVVEDDGPGIAPEHLPHVLDPFYSAGGKPESSGLGLYISRSIVEEMGGSLKIESKPGEGTRVCVRLPVGDA